MRHTTDVTWNGKMQFDAIVNGHHVKMDSSVENDGDNTGARPKPLMLAALAGCTGMDVVSLLEKMRVQLEEFHIKVDGDTGSILPNPFVKMHVIYELRVKDPDMDKINKAVRLSFEKYCGVSDVYRKAGIEMTYEIKML